MGMPDGNPEADRGSPRDTLKIDVRRWIHSRSSLPAPRFFEINCHGSLQNQPLRVDSKPATLRGGFFKWF